MQPTQGQQIDPKPERNKITDTYLPAFVAYSAAAAFMNVDESVGLGVAGVATGGLLLGYAREQGLAKSVGEIAVGVCGVVAVAAGLAKLGM